MTIHCTVCKFAIKSLGPLQVTESEQVMELMAKHLVARHPAQAAELKQELDLLFLLLSSYLLIQRYVSIPAEEKQLLQSVKEGEQALMNLFSFDPKPVA